MKNLKPLNLNNRPTIKFNGGSPLCICNNCSATIGRVKFNEDGVYVMLDGTNPPLLCQDCLNDQNNK